jgi:hypothetical protein
MGRKDWIGGLRPAIGSVGGRLAREAVDYAQSRHAWLRLQHPVYGGLSRLWSLTCLSGQHTLFA